MVNAGKILSARTKSKVAQENMDVFRDAWINQVIYFSLDKAKLLQLNRTQFPSLDIFVSKKVGNRKN